MTKISDTPILLGRCATRAPDPASPGNKWKLLNEWRECLYSQCNGLTSTTRLVLLVLAGYAGHEMKCFPSQATLAQCTALSERSVRTHLKLAEKLGWITRRRQFQRGRAWYRLVYTLQLPPGKHSDVAGDNQTVRTGVLTTGTPRHDDRNHVPTN